MDGKGRYSDNIFVERLWRSIKYEEVYLKAYQNGPEARREIGAYLDFNNQERTHQALCYQTPGEVFEQDLQSRWLPDQDVVLPSGTETFLLVAADSLNLALRLS